MSSSGFSSADAQGDFSRARRARLLADIGRRLRREPDDVGLILPFEEVVDALGVVGRADQGLQVVPLDAIVGTVDRSVDFDRGFRPTSPRLRSRWERIAAAQRRGESLPPVSLYKVGDLFFVRDGDLPLKGHERLFRERVPLSAEQRAKISLTDPWDFGTLAEAVEAWGFRATQERGSYLARHDVGDLWFTHEYEPVVEALRDGGLVERDETETDAYLRLAAMRYRALRTHEWSDEVLDELRRREERARRRRRRPPPQRRRRRVT